MIVLATFDSQAGAKDDDERARLRVRPGDEHAFAQSMRGTPHELVIPGHLFSLVSVKVGGFDDGEETAVESLSHDGETFTLQGVEVPPHGYIVVTVKNETETPQRFVGTLNGEP